MPGYRRPRYKQTLSGGTRASLFVKSFSTHKQRVFFSFLCQTDETSIQLRCYLFFQQVS
jgi:hypothetical protein